VKRSNLILVPEIAASSAPPWADGLLAMTCTASLAVGCLPLFCYHLIMFIPAYMKLNEDELLRRVEAAEELLKDCTLCPHNCHVDRTAGELGFCKTGALPVVASWGPHYGEERPLVGRFGSGTIFFANCNLACVFCQNWSISNASSLGVEADAISIERLAAIMLELKEGGCHNINLVTPTQQVPMVLRALMIASSKGLDLPIVYNCGGYESVETLELLDGIVDIYMPDFKYLNAGYAKEYSSAPGYPEIAKEALRRMYKQVGDLVIGDNGAAIRGLLVRHLVLPGNIAGTDEAMRFIAEEISPDTYVNVMDQYRPCFNADKYPPLYRRITPAEYKAALESALRAGLKRIDGETI
jgi:putative pyruvate formate lyase activating enzyme